MLTTCRSIRLNEPYGDFTTIPAPALQVNGSGTGMEHGFYLIVTGAPVSTPVMRVFIRYSYMVIPTGVNFSLLTLDYATPGIRTTDTICCMIQMLTAIQMLTS